MAAPLFAGAIEPRVVRLTIVARDTEGRLLHPVTKKNSAQIIPGRKFGALLPSEAYQVWSAGALRAFREAGMAERYRATVRGKLRTLFRWLPWPAIDYPVNCRALIYRHAATGDAVGYYQAIGDWLQLAGAVADDKHIVSWDGSRLWKDPQRPRVEVELTEVFGDG